MFDQIPNRRITQRRQNLRDALIAAVSLVAGASEAYRKGFDWNMLLWAAIFILSVLGYWQGRHEDPWNPPDADGKERYYGALEPTDASPTRSAPRKY